MNCNKCKAKMEKGAIVNSGRTWMKTNQDRLNFWEKLSTIGTKNVHPLVAWKCNACNSVELTIETK